MENLSAKAELGRLKYDPGIFERGESLKFDSEITH